MYCLFLSPSLYYLYFAISSHLAAYVFLPILAEELKEFKKRWNRHRIRWNRLSTCPCSVPNDVYHFVGHIGTAREFSLTPVP